MRDLLAELFRFEPIEDARGDAHRAVGAGPLPAADLDDLDHAERRENVRVRPLPGQFPVPYAARASQKDARGRPGETVLVPEVSDAVRDA